MELTITLEKYQLRLLVVQERAKYKLPIGGQLMLLSQDLFNLGLAILKEEENVSAGILQPDIREEDLPDMSPADLQLG